MAVARRNDEGFLVDFDAWDPAWALAIAREESIQLDNEHWHCIDIVRRFFAETGVAPANRPLIKLLASAGGPSGSIALMRLFGGRAARTLARIAGLPRPENCL